MDLIKLIKEKVEEVESSGKLNEIVEKHVLRCLNDVVEDSFRWSGEAKKSIELALKDKLAISFESLNINRYQKIVSDIVETHFNDTATESLRQSIKDAVDNVTEVIDKKEWKLSEIMSKYIDSLDKSYDGEMEDLWGKCTMIVNDSSGEFTHIYFDKEEGKRTYECENQIGLHKGKLFYVKIDENIYSPFVVRNMSNEFEEFMFKLYCNNVVVEVDEYDCELNYSREDND